MKAVKHIVEQGTEEWFDLRKGKITASVIKDIMGIRGIGKSANTLAMKIAYEYCTDFEIERFSTADTERGNELEPVARAKYEDDFNVRVDEGGFFSLDDLGVSPDGLVGDEGLTEIKCPAYKNHMKVLKSQDVDPQYVPQIQFQLLVTGRKWCDFISYCEQMPEGKQLFVKRVYADPKYQQLIMERIEALREMIQDWKNVLTL